MARDLKKENAWRKQKYKRFVVDIDRELAEEFLKKLNGKAYSDWIREKIETFLKK